jgi:transposase-like protein
VHPLDWLLVIGLWPLKLNATDMAAAADIQERTAPRCINWLAGGIDETYHLEPSRQLEHQVEADECYQSAGSKGLPREVERHDRAPRQRGLQLRGRATAELGRPPLLGFVHRRDKAAPEAPAAQVSLDVLENVRRATIKPIIAAKVQSGAQFFPDEYNIYHFTKVDYDHRTVNHGAGEYARRDPDGTCVHCNTMEGMWSGLRHFLDHFRGISQRFLHLRVARYEFLHNHGPLHWRQTCEVALRCLFSTTGDYWRWMAHQHRRMPLTLCYR